MNLTNSCYGNGVCESISGVETCFCVLRWLSSTDCRTNIHQVYNATHEDLFFTVIGLIGFSVVTCLFLTDIILEVIIKRGSTSRKLNFLFKCVSVFANLSRISYISFWAYFTNNGLNNDLELIDQIIFAVGNVASFAMYYGLILMWVDLVSRLISLSKTTTKMFLFSRTIILIILAVNVPLQLVSAILYTLGSSPIASFVYLGSAAIFLLGGVVWSSTYVIKLHLATEDMNIALVKRKNMLVGFVNCVAIIFVVLNALISILPVNDNPNLFLGLDATIRFTEMIMGFLIAFAVENYLLMGKDKILEAINNGEKDSSKDISKIKLNYVV